MPDSAVAESVEKTLAIARQLRAPGRQRRVSDVPHSAWESAAKVSVGFSLGRWVESNPVPGKKRTARTATWLTGSWNAAGGGLAFCDLVLFDKASERASILARFARGVGDIATMGSQ